ncbi:hypothetical protein BC831DRAFT_439948 [Entophlyctis helioformis]|nr:hypothetical protein BC831DRAFT_439948 [Entophlyctis helioformis]
MTILVSSSNPVPVINIHSLASSDVPASGTGPSTGASGGGGNGDGLQARARTTNQQVSSSPAALTNPAAPTAASVAAAARKADLHALHAKQASRILSLERTIEYLQDQHATTLKSLHGEVERLQGVVSDLMLKTAFRNDDGDRTHVRRRSALLGALDITGRRGSILRSLGMGGPSNAGGEDDAGKRGAAGSGADHGGQAQQSTATASDFFSKMRDWMSHSDPDSHNRNAAASVIGGTGVSGSNAGARGAPASINAAIMAATAAANSANNQAATHAPEQPMYILVDRERKKYQGMIERMNEENKRKQAEIDQMRGEMSVVREVLALAGLTLDLKEFQNIIQAKNQQQQQQPNQLRTAAIVGSKRTLVPSNVVQVSLKSKISVLPPIGAKRDDRQPAHSQQHESLADHHAEGSGRTGKPGPADARLARGAVVAPPADDVPGVASGKIRAVRYRPRTENGAQDGQDGADERSDARDGMARGDDAEQQHVGGGGGGGGNDDSVAAIQLHNQNLDYNHRAHLTYGNEHFYPGDEDVGEINGFVEAAPTEDARSQMGGVVGDDRSTVYPQPRRVRVPSNTMSATSGSGTLQSAEAYAEMMYEPGQMAAVQMPYGFARAGSGPFPPGTSPKGSPPGVGASLGRDRVYGSLSEKAAEVLFRQQQQQQQQQQSQAKASSDQSSVQSSSLSPNESPQIASKGYAGRMARSKIVRDQRWKNAKEKGL